jgi:hypothetical protein
VTEIFLYVFNVVAGLQGKHGVSVPL